MPLATLYPISADAESAVPAPLCKISAVSKPDLLTPIETAATITIATPIATRCS